MTVDNDENIDGGQARWFLYFGSIELKSEESEITIVAPESITLIQRGARVILKDNIILSGAQANIQ